MPVPKRKRSKMKKRQHKGANRYRGVEANFCVECKAPVLPHRVCQACGKYHGKQVLTIKEA